VLASIGGIQTQLRVTRVLLENFNPKKGKRCVSLVLPENLNRNKGKPSVIHARSILMQQAVQARVLIAWSVCPRKTKLVQANALRAPSESLAKIAHLAARARFVAIQVWLVPVPVHRVPVDLRKENKARLRACRALPAHLTTTHTKKIARLVQEGGSKMTQGRPAARNVQKVEHSARLG
jgi:hypothetical protein